MLRRYQRFFALGFCLLIFAPLIVSFVDPRAARIVDDENRFESKYPGVPHTIDDLMIFSHRIDRAIADRFGFRKEMIWIFAYINWHVFHYGNDNVWIGDNGRLFYRADNAIRQSAGVVRRDADVLYTVDFLSKMQGLLNSGNTRLIVGIPPNSSTIYDHDLPPWARSNGRPTEYDLLVDGLRGRGVAVIDLREPLRQASTTGGVYFLHDTHWTARGSIVGFNSVADAAGHPDWKVDLNSALSPPANRPGGDLAGQIGVVRGVTETSQDIAWSANPEIALKGGHPLNVGGQEPFFENGRVNGATIAILGDSFTRSFFPPLFVKKVAKFVWIHHEACGFDWSLIDQIHPDEVWWMPAERASVCKPGRRPDHFPL